MRTTWLLPLALIAAPALAFDEAQVLQPGALSGLQAVFVTPTTLALPEPTGRWERQRGFGSRPITTRDAQARADDLTTALRRGIDQRFELVDAPGPGVLVVEPTLTRLEASRPTMADFHQQPSLSFQSMYAGGAAVTLRLSRDGEVVAVIEDRYQGSFIDGQPRIGVWQDADRAFSRWSRQLPTFLDEPKTASR